MRAEGKAKLLAPVGLRARTSYITVEHQFNERQACKLLAVARATACASA